MLVAPAAVPPLSPEQPALFNILHPPIFTYIPLALGRHTGGERKHSGSGQ